MGAGGLVTQGKEEEGHTQTRLLWLSIRSVISKSQFSILEYDPLFVPIVHANHQSKLDWPSIPSQPVEWHPTYHEDVWRG